MLVFTPLMADAKAKKRAKSRMRGRRSPEGWRADALELQLSPDDLDLLDNVLTVVPILRIVAAIGQETRRRGMTYPVSAVAELQSLLGDDTLVYGDHRIDRDTIAQAMPESWFPVTHEGELLSRVHLALLRCEFEAPQMTPRPALHNT
jgi:hypothetical protein